ncbi:hypothetical protein HH304_10645 [Flammeovirgaceae bacterium KN852]|uniref:Uncharacterized protein n=2 Tax=Marinigracilibium pacificum TaxID=2729599 RepID=A0A848J3D4_9BACT|nr:hypothetical protein [Marinigracilibium pacificum]
MAHIISNEDPYHEHSTQITHLHQNKSNSNNNHHHNHSNHSHSHSHSLLDSISQKVLSIIDLNDDGHDQDNKTDFKFFDHLLIVTSNIPHLDFHPEIGNNLFINFYKDYIINLVSPPPNSFL